MSITSDRAVVEGPQERGWTFVGPTTCYAFMQAMGLVNDHIDACHVRAEIEALRAKFVRPAKLGSSREI